MGSLLVDLVDLERVLREELDLCNDWNEMRKLTDDIGKVMSVQKMVKDRNILTKEYYIVK